MKDSIIYYPTETQALLSLPSLTEMKRKKGREEGRERMWKGRQGEQEP
jgi:hypothetical protein